ncbi:hypothetical protein [Falsiporphyromonas endometrii]|uniref:Uncharacterized protein n=1 Tax=Falsiporphyromonas endometrii TaxID=1387297 RepID=A0ABV9K5F4_9PORP
MRLRQLIFGMLACMSILILTGSKTIYRNGQEPLQVGDVLPEIQTLLGVQKENPKPTMYLVQFWTSYDGESRANNIRWQNLLSSKALANKIVYRGVSLEPEESIFKHTLTIDKLKKDQQVMIKSKGQTRAKQDYGLEQRFHSYLLDQRGIIKAVDPDWQHLAKLMN